MIMINEFFILGIIFIPFFILKLEDLQKIVTAIVYVNILYYIYSYYTDPISKFLFDGVMQSIKNDFMNFTRFGGQ